jgi:hypothetical protein
MKVFISWSGEQSKQLAEAIKEWLPRVLQSVELYFSDTDIQAGARWYSEIIDALEKSDAGLVILTPENITRQWIMFEAGAIARSVEKGRVCPILFGIEKSDLKGPLAFFQSAEFAEDDFRKLLRTLNGGRLGDADFKDVFDTWWPKLEEKIEVILSSQPPSPAPRRQDRDLLEEAVSNTRAILRELTLPPWQRTTTLNPEVLATLGTLLRPTKPTPQAKGLLDLYDDGTVAKSE